MITARIDELVARRGKNNTSKFARDLGMRRQTAINLINNNEPERMDLKTIEKLCRVLNVLPTDLFRITNDDGTEWKPAGWNKPKPYTIKIKKKTPPSV